MLRASTYLFVCVCVCVFVKRLICVFNESIKHFVANRPVLLLWKFAHTGSKRSIKFVVICNNVYNNACVVLCSLFYSCSFMLRFLWNCIHHFFFFHLYIILFINIFFSAQFFFVFFWLTVYLLVSFSFNKPFSKYVCFSVLGLDVTVAIGRSESLGRRCAQCVWFNA